MNCNNCIHFDLCYSHYDLRRFDGCAAFKSKDLFIELPCKIGSTVYKSIYCATGNNECFCELSPCSKCNRRVHWIIATKMKLSYLDKIGISVFLTKEEAEKSLKEREYKC